VSPESLKFAAAPQTSATGMFHFSLASTAGTCFLFAVKSVTDNHGVETFTSQQRQCVLNIAGDNFEFSFR